MSDQESLFHFPCQFPIKIMAEKDMSLEAFVRSALEEHIQNLDSIDMKSRESRDGNYISITATFEAESREQLDTLYQIFTGHEKVKMVL